MLMVRTFIIAALAFFCAAPVQAQTTLSRGTYTVSSIALSNCGPDVPTTPVARDACLRFATVCPSVDDRSADVKVTFEVGTYRGTVVLFAGGDGGGFYETAFPAAGTLLLARLRDAGYRVAQPRWIGNLPAGHLGSSIPNPIGPRGVGCRQATLVEALYSNTTVNPGGGRLRLTGNSGGSTGILLGLSHYNTAPMVSRAVLSGGPPHGRMDFGCVGNLRPSWVTRCAALKTVSPAGRCEFDNTNEVGANFMDYAYGDGRTTCVARVAGRTLFRDSVCSPLGTYYFTDTALTFVWGSTDSSEATTLGRVCAAWYTQATHVVANTSDLQNGHFIPASADGADRIFTALTN
jgi:hypothetical protein